MTFPGSSKHVGLILFTTGLLATCLTPGPFTHAQEFPDQEVHRRDFVPIGDEIFSVITQFYDFDDVLPLDVRTIEEWEEDTARFETVVFTTSSGERVPGDLVLPKSGTPPYPAVLLIHGLGSDRDRWWKDDREVLPKGLLEAGIAVFTIDLRFHGQRIAENDYQSPVYLTLGNSLFVRSRNMLIQSTIDSRRALDFLRQREEIDGGRIAVVGYSMGGMIALYLSALEDGLVAFVACAVPTTEQPLPVDHFNFAPRARASGLLQIGRDDWLSSPEDAEILRDLLPGEDRRLTFYDAGHRLPTKFASDAALWLRERLVARYHLRKPAPGQAP
jgi:pimeloyl-ACP methyl ester carboxylesterase